MSIKQVKLFVQNHRTAVGVGGAVVGFAIASVYFFVVPFQPGNVEGVTVIVLLYAHSLCWFLLGLSCLMYALRASEGLVRRLAYGGLGAYLLFIVYLLYSLW